MIFELTLVEILDIFLNHSEFLESDLQSMV